MVPIILQCYNRVEYTIQTIMSIHNNILYPHHLIVIDNNSTDGTREYLELMYKQGFIHTLVLNEKNEGISVPKNQGLDIVREMAKTQEIEFLVITDNDITPPFIREGGCVLQHIVDNMKKNPIIGMCGVDLSRQNAPLQQEWWWRLRQHFANIPEFTEISIGFWFSVFRWEDLKDFKFVGESNYGRVDESVRNYLGLEKKRKVGLLKGVYDPNKKQTIEYVGTHLGWTEDNVKYSEYVNFKKQERYKAEVAWREKNRKW